MAKRVKKRSLRGKLLLTILYITLVSLILVVVLPIINSVYEEDDESVERNQVASDKEPVSIIHNEPTLYQNEVENKTEPNTNEGVLVSKLLEMVGIVSYADNCTWRYNNGEVVTKGIDSFGLVELAYYIENNQYLSDIEITEDNLDECMEVRVNELKIGDIGISNLPNGNIYGIYIGDYSNYPLFIYACSLPMNKFPDGSVYISFDKNTCNDLFIGMFPMAYDKYVRLPDMNLEVSTDIKLSDYLEEGIIPTLEFNTYATAAYKIGDWLRTNDKESLVDRVNVEVLENNGFYLDKEYYEKYIDSYNSNYGHDNYIYVLDSYTKSEDYIITIAEIVNVGKSDVMFERTGTYLTMTIYEDGSYIPAPVFSLSKYANLYGFKKIVTEGEEEATKQIGKIDRSSDYVVDLESLYRGFENINNK